MVRCLGTFQRFAPVPIPLHEFPFGRARRASLDFGLAGDQGRGWGYHFGNSFRLDNPHFHRLVAEGVIFSAGPGDLLDRFRWLGGERPWGVPGWAMPEAMLRLVMRHTAAFAGRDVLELGTSRGRTTAIMAGQGCRVTTIDHVDRGARQNLAGLSVEVVIDDAVRYARGTPRTFDLIVCDVHGNSPAEWARLGAPQARLAAAGIGTKVHWATPLHRQAGPWPTHGHFPGAERWCAEVVSLPCFPGLLPEEVERVCDVVEAALSGRFCPSTFRDSITTSPGQVGSIHRNIVAATRRDC